MPPPWNRGFTWPVRIVSGELPPLQGWQPVLGGPHEEIHEGHYFRVYWVNLTLANNGTIDLLIRPGEYAAHTVMYAACGGDATLLLHEDVTYDTPGATVQPRNANRQVARVAEGNTTLANAFPVNPVLGGDTLITRFVPGGSAGVSIGSESGIRQEWILDPEFGTPAVKRNYLIRLTNISGGTQPASLEVEWYEFRPF